MPLIEISFLELGVPAWSWWILRDIDTGFGDGVKEHPWILDAEYSPRTEFAHGIPRSTKRYSDNGIEHNSHNVSHESSCYLDQKGWVLPRCARPLRPESLDDGRFSCKELSDTLLKSIQNFDKL